EHGDDLTARILLGAAALHDIAVLEPHLVAREEAEEALRRRLCEVVALEPDLGAEAEAAQTEFGPLRMRRRRAGLAVRLAAEHFDPVHELELERIQHRHCARRLAFEVVTQG